MSDVEFKTLGLVDQAALNFLKTKRLQPSFNPLDIWIYEHSVAFTVAKMMDEDMLATVKQALEDAIENGTGFETFKKTLKPYLMSKGWWGEKIMLDPVDGVPKLVQLGSTRRLRRIYQTNIATAYAAGQWERIQATKDGLPYLRYNPSAATNKREAHKQYYGLVLPVEHPLWKQIYPPNGYGCLCSVSQLTQGQAERFGISDEPDVPYQFIANPRTGEIVRVPADITPTFAHNHGDRIGALDLLYSDKFGLDRLAQMQADREKYLDDRYRLPMNGAVKIVEMPDGADPKEIERLTSFDGKNIVRPHEAEAAAELEAAMGATFEIFDLPVAGHEPKADFLVRDPNLPREQWLRVDFMYTKDKNNLDAIEDLNSGFGDDRWDKHTDNIDKHIKKAHIVPLDFRRLNAVNRAKVLGYVLSLPKEQRDHIWILVRKSK